MNNTRTEFNKAIKLLKFADQIPNLDDPNTSDISNLSEPEDLQSNETINLDTVKVDSPATQVEDDSNKKPKKKNKSQKPTGLDKKIFDALEGKPYTPPNAKEKAQQKALEQARRIEEQENPNPEVIADHALNTLHHELEPSDSGLEKGLSTQHQPTLVNLTSSNLEKRDYGAWTNRAHRHLQREMNKEQIDSLINKAEEENDNKVILQCGLTSDAIDSLNAQRKELGFDIDTSNEIKAPIVQDVSKGVYYQDEQTTLDINKYLEIYGKLHAIVLNDDTLNLIDDPLFFYTLLKQLDSANGTSETSPQSKRFQFSGFIYQIVEISTELSRKISKFEKEKINHVRMGEQFINWLYTQLKEILVMIAPDVNLYLKNNEEEKVLPLNNETISDLINSSGGYLNELIKSALKSKDEFLDIISESLQKEVGKEQDARTQRFIYKHELTAGEKLRGVCKAMLEEAQTFPANSAEAKAVINIYLDAINFDSVLSTQQRGEERVNEHGNIEPNKNTIYEHTVPHWGDEDSTVLQGKDNPAGKTYPLDKVYVGQHHPPDRPQLDTDEISKTKDMAKELFTNGKTYSNENPILEYKVYPDINSRRVTIVTHLQDINAKNEVERTLNNLQKSENILSPDTALEKKIISIGRKLVGLERVKELKEQGKKVSNKDALEIINKPFDANLVSTGLFDEDGNRRTDLTEEQEEAISFPRAVISAAKKYFDENPDIFDLVGTFKINANNSITKVYLDTGILRNYGVKVPELLPAYYQNEKKQTKTASSNTAANITVKSSISDVYKFVLNKIK